MTRPASARCATGLAVVAALLVLAATGCCLVDGRAHHDHSTGVDLCGGLAIIAMSAPFSLLLGLAGMSVGRRAWAVTPFAVSIPHPPPRR